MSKHASAPQPLRHIPAAVIGFFWVFQFSVQSAQRLLMGQQDTFSFVLPRIIATCIGALLSALILKVHERQAGSALTYRALTALVVATVGSGLHALANFCIFQIFMGEENLRQATFESMVPAILFWFWCYFAVSCLLLALVYSRELSQRERDFANLETLTQAAQLRALRYQLNPHFMFNTLNSIAALICTGENGTAERMIEGLGDFLRATLAIDPQEDHTLDEEIKLQKLYLGIEQLRFPDRLSVNFEVEKQTSAALLPSLILQPLTENAIKHSVAVSSGRTQLRVSSRTQDGRLLICVSNSPPESSARQYQGTGVGLSNVEERLRARFGDGQRLQYGKGSDGSFEVRMEMPLNFGAA